MGVQINGDTGNVIATKGTFSGDVGIGGTLTYEDVTNIDAVGLITARSGIEIGARPGVAASISVDGNAIFSGVTTVGGRIDTTDATDGALNATFTRGMDKAFQLQFRNHGTTNGNRAGVGSFGVFRGNNDIVGLSFKRGVGAAGAGSLAVTQAGVEKVRVDYTGYVGIGSTQPLKKLTINTSSGGDGGILIQPAAAYANNTDRAYLIVGTDGWTDATTNWDTYGFQHRFKSNESGVGRVTIDTVSGEAFNVDTGGNVGIGTVTQLGKLAIGKATGGYIGNHGIIVNRPHSLGLKNGVLVYTDNAYNPTASYNAAAFKAVGTTGMAVGVSTDQGNTGLGGSINYRVNFDGQTIQDGSITANGSFYQEDSSATGGDDAQDKTIEFNRRGVFLMLISYSLGTTTTDINRNVYSLGLFVSRSNGATWVPIQEDLNSTQVGNLTISDASARGKLRVQKSSGSDARACAFRIDVLSSADVKITVTDT